MTVSDYLKQNRHVFGYGLLGLALLISLSYNLPRTSIPTHARPLPPVQPTTATSSATMTATISGSLSITPVSTTSGMCHARYISKTDPQAVLPDPNCTPGAINPSVTQSTIQETICTVGYTQTIRPSVNYTEPLKIQSIKEYGYADTNLRNYEEDHFIPLELGGNATNVKNLWAEPHPSMNEKDKVESYLHQQVCDKNITLIQAQKEITTDWYAVYQSLPASDK